MSRVLLLAATTGYQTRAFGEAADRLGVDLRYATDRCHVLEDPWRDQAVAIRFHEEDAAVAAILESARHAPIDGLLAVGDRPVVIAARVAEALDLPGHPPRAAEASRNKLLARERLARAGLPVPWFTGLPIDATADEALAASRFPCIVKPLALSGSRGVIRADDPGALRNAFERVGRLLRSPDVREMRDPAGTRIVVEGFVGGREYALEGVVEKGTLRPLAIFDKPDPLDGPFFEETIYVTPSRAGAADRAALVRASAAATAALGLRHGPVHVECRVNERGVFVLEVAARPIGGLCARALRFVRRGGPAAPVSLEELLLRQALGEPVSGWGREADASGVMMLPIPKAGRYRGVDGVAEARAVPGVTDVRITAKPDQPIVPLPEGASYLGFIFARGRTPQAVERALRRAHAALRFRIDAYLACCGT